MASLLLVAATYLLLLLANSAYSSSIKINPATRQFVDEFGRERVFHGVNAVYKFTPYYPSTTGFDSNNTLSDVDASLLASYGFNIVRLGLIWGAIEPTSKGEYNMTYLENIAQIVNILYKQDIYVILDLHQDLWHRQYCGEGVPDWLQKECSSDSTKQKPFPAPVVRDGPYPIDADGNPELASCLSKSFFEYYLTSAVSSAFQCLYDNKRNQWDALGSMWKTVARTFKSYKNVIGYEILNEPWFGDIYNNPSTLVPGKTEKMYLQPMYEVVNRYIRTEDSESIVFFEGLTMDYFPSGFEASPGPASFNDRQALSYHIYCLPNPNKVEVPLCAGANDEFFAMRNKDGERLGVATLMTEFGAAQEELKGSLLDLESLAKQSDRHKQSWMYWQYKYYQDLTTCTPSGESLFNNDGTPAIDKLTTLTRPYPEAIAGSLNSYEFDIKTNKFSLAYTVAAIAADADAHQQDVASRTSIIRLNPAIHFPTGVHVDVAGTASASIKFDCGSGIASSITLIQATGSSAGGVEVTLTPCSTTAACSCTFKK